MPQKPKKPPAEKNGKKPIPEKESSPTYFLSLTLENVRCFGEKQTLDLSDGKGRPAPWTVILGDNGVGKTTLLQALCTFFPLRLHLDPRQSILPVNFIMSFPRRGVKAASQSLLATHNCKLTDKESNFLKEEFSWRIECSLEGNELKAHNMRTMDMLLCAYGAGRRMGSGALSEGKLDDPVASLFSEDIPLRNAEEWLLQADYMSSVESEFKAQSQRNRDQILALLKEVLLDVEDIRFTTVPSRNGQLRRGIEFATPYGWLPIRSLSVGYQTMIAWMVDLASRLFERYPDSEDPLQEPAVVLVDEIDLHLHPQWQRKIMGYLRERFPNTQFIVTAHSPLVVQASAEANLAVLRREGDHVVIDNNPQNIRGWRVDQLLTSDLFGLESARPPALDDLLKRRKEILSKARVSKADQKKLKEIEAQIGALPGGEFVEDIEAMDIIRRAAQNLKRQGRDLDAE